MVEGGRHAKSEAVEMVKGIGGKAEAAPHFSDLLWGVEPLLHQQSVFGPLVGDGTSPSLSTLTFSVMRANYYHSPNPMPSSTSIQKSESRFLFFVVISATQKPYHYHPHIIPFSLFTILTTSSHVQTYCDCRLQS